jgi:hypothetical protein
MLLSYALAEIERLKAIVSRLSDGRTLLGSSDGGGTSGVEALPHVDLGSKHTKSLRVTAGVGLNANHEEGTVRIDETWHSVAAGSIELADNETNYVFVDSSGTVGANTTGFPTNCVPLAEVVTAAGAIASVTDRRSYLYGHHGPHFAGDVEVDGAVEVGGGLKVGEDAEINGDIEVGGTVDGINVFEHDHGPEGGAPVSHENLEDVEADQHHAGFIGVLIAGPTEVDPGDDDRIQLVDSDTVSWDSPGAGQLRASSSGGNGGPPGGGDDIFAVGMAVALGG